MEIKYSQKVKRQIRLHHVISLIFLVFSSCSVQNFNKQLKEDSYQVINQEINYLMNSGRYKSFLLERKLNNFAAALSIDRLEFSESEKSEIVFLKNKIYIDEIINYQKLDIANESNIKIIDSKKKDQNFVINTTKKLIVLSKPIFSENKKYAMIRHYFGNILGGGNEVVTIYIKENNKWIVYNRILLGIG